MYDVCKQIFIKVTYVYVFLGVRCIYIYQVGSKVTKKYDVARTPFRRVLESKFIDGKIKEELKRNYDSLNPADLKRKISKLQDKLLKLNSLKKTLERNSTVDEKSYEYIYR